MTPQRIIELAKQAGQTRSTPDNCGMYVWSANPTSLQTFAQLVRNEALEELGLYSSPTAEMSEANARRLVACWNACLEIPTELLENLADDEATIAPIYRDLIVQRDKLLAVLRGVQKRCAPSGFVGMDGQYLKEVGAAIAKAEGDAA